MRYQLIINRKGHSTKAERKFSEILKNNHIKFRTKVKLFGKEVDFLIGNNVFEIDSHLQDVDKNKKLIDSGYNVYHLANNNICFETWFIEWLKKICR